MESHRRCRSIATSSLRSDPRLDLVVSRSPPVYAQGVFCLVHWMAFSVETSYHDQVSTDGASTHHPSP